MRAGITAKGLRGFWGAVHSIGRVGVPISAGVAEGKIAPSAPPWCGPGTAAWGPPGPEACRRSRAPETPSGWGGGGSGPRRRCRLHHALMRSGESRWLKTNAALNSWDSHPALCGARGRSAKAKASASRQNSFQQFLLIYLNIPRRRRRPRRPDTAARRPGPPTSPPARSAGPGAGRDRAPGGPPGRGVEGGAGRRSRASAKRSRSHSASSKELIFSYP
jgi:hypothetical protein